MIERTVPILNSSQKSEKKLLRKKRDAIGMTAELLNLRIGR